MKGWREKKWVNEVGELVKGRGKREGKEGEERNEGAWGKEKVKGTSGANKKGEVGW